MEFWIGVLTSSIACIVYRYLHMKFFTDGTLRMDSNDPEKDIYRLELKDLDSLHRKKRIVLRVDHNANLSQK